MGESDLKILIAFMFIGILWGTFNSIMYKSDISYDIEGLNYETPVTKSIFTLDFLDYLFISSDIAIINIFVITPMTFILIVVGYRLLRGI